VRKNPKSSNSPTSTRPVPEARGGRRAWLIPLIAAALVAACATPLAFIPVTPLLSAALATRGEDYLAAQQIAELEQKQDWQGLARLAQQRLLRYPDSEDWMLVLGVAQIQLKAYPRAIETLSRAVEHNPEEMDAWNLLGEALRLDGQKARAIQLLERAAGISSSTPATRFLLGELYSETGRKDRAEAAYLEAVRLEPEFSPAWFGLGVLLVKTGRTGEVDAIVRRLERLSAPLARELAGMAAGNK